MRGPGSQAVGAQDGSVVPWKWAILASVIITLFWTASLCVSLYVTPAPTMSDVFAPANALFSGFAFVGIVLALVLQKHDLDVQFRTNEQRVADDTKQKKLDTTFNMHREFNSEAMHKSRNTAGHLVEKYPLFSIRDYHKQLPIEETVHLSNVLGFYYRLALLVKHDQTDIAYIPELFGQILVWWWVNLCEEKERPDWETVREVETLIQFIRAIKPNDYDRWVRRAQEDRAGYLAAYNATGSLAVPIIASPPPESSTVSNL